MRIQAIPTHSIFPTPNLLLDRLSADDAALVQPFLTRVALHHREVLADPDVPFEFIYFPEDGIASVVEVFEDGNECEVGLVGHEGMTGTPVALATDRTPCRIYMQIEGTSALRIGVQQFMQALRQSRTLTTAIQNYIHFMAIQVANTAAVNARYDIATRLARWLLMCHDRVPGDDLLLTHDALSIMLAVRRPSVTVALQAIEASGAISVSRGRTTITGRAILERLAAGAYGLSEREYRRVLGPFGREARIYPVLESAK